VIAMNDRSEPGATNPSAGKSVPTYRTPANGPRGPTRTEATTKRHACDPDRPRLITLQRGTHEANLNHLAGPALLGGGASGSRYERP
jgi:hypothetical protein